MAAIGQKAKVLSAYKHHELYISNKKCEELASAKSDIDEASNDIQTAQWAKTWFYKGNIYFDIAVSDNKACNELGTNPLHVAYQAYRRSLDLDVKNYYSTDIQTRLAVIGPYFLNQGIQQYNAGEFELALQSFVQSSEISGLFDKIDTLAIYNAALSAEQLNANDTAVVLYQQLIDLRYGGGNIHRFLANLYAKQGDSIAQLKTLDLGRRTYPRNEDLITEQLNYFLAYEQYEQAKTLIDELVTANENNPLYFYYKGAIYENLKLYSEAELAYSNAIRLKSDYFDAYYNLGVLFFNEGVELNEEAFSENSSEAKREAARKKFEQALPYLEQANALNVSDYSTLISLQKVYSILGDDEGYQRVTEELEN